VKCAQATPSRWNFLSFPDLNPGVLSHTHHFNKASTTDRSEGDLPSNREAISKNRPAVPEEATEKKQREEE
jgi:hypothetical protein